MQAVPPLPPPPPLGVECVVVVGGGVECVVVGGGVEWVVVGGGVECVVVGAGVGADDVVVDAGAALVVAVVCAVRCCFALWWAFACFFTAVVVVGVVAVVSGCAAFVELVDDDAPQPAATIASDIAAATRIDNRLIRILDNARRPRTRLLPERRHVPHSGCYGIPTSELSPTMNR
jgi:hypothetical protein